MIPSYLKIFSRNVARHKLYSTVNVMGLAMGLAISLLVLSYLFHELSFEDFHEHKNRIYRVNGKYVGGDDDISSARVMAPLGPAIAAEISEVEKVATFRVQRIETLKQGPERFKVVDLYRNALWTHHANIIFASPEFLEVFNLPVIQGDPSTALREPFSMMVTQRAAVAYFDDPNPIGKVIKINDAFECQVAGILKDIPQNTQLYCDFLISYSTLEKLGREVNSWNKYRTDYVYLLLHKGADRQEVEGKLSSLIKSHLGAAEADRHTFSLQPLKDIYFSAIGSGRRHELSPIGEWEVIIIFAFIAAFILMQAIANFVNLSIARSTDRRREVGVRKVFGAHRGHLMIQFLCESVVFALLAMLIGIALYEWLKPPFQGLYPREMLVDLTRSPNMMISVAALIVAVGLISGYYPALYLSRFHPIAVLQHRSNIKSTKSWLRRGLVVFQFVVAIFFIVSSSIIFRQIQYVTTYDLGFDQKDMLVLNFEGEDRAKDCQLMRNELAKNRHVLAATMADNPLGRRENSYCLFDTSENFRKEHVQYAQILCGDYDFLSTFRLKVIAGRDFSPEIPSDAKHAIIVTNSTLQHLGLDHPLGQKLYTENGFLEIIGVVEDYHGYLVSSLSPPSFILYDPEKFDKLVIKLAPGEVSAALKSIERTWKEHFPSQDFKYSFLDDTIRANYKKYQDSMKIFTVLALLSIAIAALGILGLVSFTAQQRTKEIGIRKVLGSSIPGIIWLLSKEYVILIAIANLIAWPLAWSVMNGMLQDFAVRISLNISSFFLAGLLALALALAIVSFQAFKAAVANPVNSLRYE
ncbi:MAG: ABC transporter permease [Desulfurivibrio sp.]|nr:MAG: ABC transporter permease [Desulfurivibrio sp.]